MIHASFFEGDCDLCGCSRCKLKAKNVFNLSPNLLMMDCDELERVDDY